MDKIKLKNVVEAILLASDRILTINQLEKLLTEQPISDASAEIDERKAANDAKAKDDAEASEAQETEESTNLKRAIKEVLEMLQSDYSGRAMELKEVASGYRFQVRQGYADYVGRLWEEKPAKYSRALLETLVLIAYRQPITRGEIEAIRGVSVSSHIVKTLIERDWVRVIGHRDVPGKPSIYGTTKEFLDYFNLTSLDDLPSLADVKDLDKIAPELELDDQATGSSASTDPHKRVIEIRQARRQRRLRRQFGIAEEPVVVTEVEDTAEQSVTAEAATDTAAFNQRQIEIRQARRQRRLQRQFGQTEKNATTDNGETANDSTTSQENESAEMELS